MIALTGVKMFCHEVDADLEFEPCMIFKKIIFSFIFVDIKLILSQAYYFYDSKIVNRLYPMKYIYFKQQYPFQL